MKILFSLLLTFAMATPVLAQGKVRLVNDSLHLVYFNPNTAFLLPGDAALAGQAYALGSSSQTLRIELWAGTASASLSLVATTDFAGQAGALGTWGGMNVTLPTAAGATFFQINIIGVTGPGPYYFGTSGLFTTVSSSTIAYNSLVNHNSPANSTWANGTWNLDSLSPGFRGAIELSVFPEPSTFALGSLGFALLLARRRSQNNKDSIGK
jgi:uncharacterized protein (TIGR03382 family)